MKDLFRKQIIISIGTNNMEKVIVQSNAYVANINRLLKGIKLKISVNFIQFDNRDIIVTTNKIATILNLNNIDSSNIISPKLLQSKFYLKILGILYCVKDINLPITTDIVVRIIQTTHIFNNVILASHLYIIKASSKSDMAVI